MKSENNEKPLISVIVPVYNVAGYLERCMKSILNQSYKCLEIILVDDGSTDGSGEKCDRYALLDSRVKVIHKKNGGLSDARNVGIENSSGKFISFIDSDDWISPFYISILYDSMVKYDADVSICKFKVSKDESIEFITSEKCTVYSSEQAIEALLYQHISNSAWGKLYKRELWSNLIFPVGKLYEDLEPSYIVIKNSRRVVYNFSDLYAYYVRNGSIVRKEFSVRKMDYHNTAQNVKRMVAKDYPNLVNASICRLVWADLHLICQINDDEFENEQKILWDEIKKYRWQILKDKKARKINKLILIISFLGKNSLKFAYGLKAKLG